MVQKQEWLNEALDARSEKDSKYEYQSKSGSST